MNIKIYKKIVPVFVVPTVFSSIVPVCSCSNKAGIDTIYNADGSNWQGVVRGRFYDNGYVIDQEEKTITYTNGYYITGTNIVLPDFVILNNVFYKVLLGEKCFENNHFIEGDFLLNNFVSCIPKNCFCNCDGLISITLKNFITKIDDHAFSSCLLLKHIVNTIYLSKLEYIGDYAFYDSLIDIDFPFGNELEKIGDNAFAESTGITILNFFNCNKLKEIGNHCFFHCQSLYDVTFSANIERVGDYAFTQCTLLDTIKLPSNNMNFSVGQGCFSQNPNFKGFSRKCQFTHLGERAFQGCNKFSVNEYMLSNPQLTYIPDFAFDSCCNNEVVIPKNISIIYRFAFANNKGKDGDSLSVVDFSSFEDWQLPTICGEAVFYNCSDGGVIFIPNKSSYDQWRELLTNKGFSFGEGKWLIKTH